MGGGQNDEKGGDPMICPQPNFHSRYMRPQTPPTIATTVEVADGARIACYCYGEPSKKAPVLMLHGNGGEHGVFGPIIDALVESGRFVIGVDSRAQGKSSRGSAPITYELMAEDTLAVFDALRVERAHILGYSDGGILCLILASCAPEKVASITTLGANITPTGVVEEPAWDLAGTIRENRAWADFWLDPSKTSGQTLPEDVDRTLLTPSPLESMVSAELLQLMLDHPNIARDSLTAIRCPATIVVGEWDCIAEYETAQIVRSIPGARLVVIDAAPHSLPRAEPDRVLRLLTETIEAAEASR